MRKNLLTLAALAACAVLVANANASPAEGQFTGQQQPAINPAAPRPNILYFYVDDMGCGAIGPNGQAARKAKGLPYVLTPTLDRLAREGVNFARSYGATVCSPARSCQQTGFHQGHTFADRNDPDNAKKAMRADDVLIGDALSKAGYVTGYWGKWGYGASKDQVDPVIQNIQTLPTSHGYQHVVAELHHVRAHTFFQPTLWTAPAAPGAIGGLELKPNSMEKYIGDPAYPDTPALQNHPDYPATAYCDDVYAFAALDFVRAQAANYLATGQPFFGLVAVQIPHAPFNDVAQLPEWAKAYQDLPFFPTLSEQSQEWAAMVTRIDAHFGNILAALEDPNGDGDCSDSIADDTLVIFQSDNGGPQHPANQEFDANGGLRGNKGKIYEGGIRIPTLMRWPSRITDTSTLKRGTTTHRVIDVSDLLPTFCDLAGVPAPLGIDGVSFAPILLGSGYQRTREFIVHEAGGGQSIIRGKYKLVRTKKSFELYDLEADPAESNNIAADHPAMVQELTELLLGERVTEPRGFANTYHHWIGGDNGAASDPDNWSDYVYANAGITYLADDGEPKVSWTALMENSGKKDATARADTDLDFLGLEVRGGTATQTLFVGTGIQVTGRNEVRISGGGRISLHGGTIASLRWLETMAGGMLQGSGTVAATLYNRGMVDARTTAAGAGIRIESDYVEYPGASLRLQINGQEDAPLEIAGDAILAGELTVSLGPEFSANRGQSLVLIKAGAIHGRFSNPEDRVVSQDGTSFDIGYTATAVTLTAR